LAAPFSECIFTGNGAVNAPAAQGFGNPRRISMAKMALIFG